MFSHFGCNFLSLFKIAIFCIKVSEAVTCKAMETKNFILLVKYTVLKYRLFQKWEEFDNYSCFLKAACPKSNLKYKYMHRERDISLEQKYTIFVMV